MSIVPETNSRRIARRASLRRLLVAALLYAVGCVDPAGPEYRSVLPQNDVISTGPFIGLDAGARFTCALRHDGAAQCWGENNHGQAPPLVVDAHGRYTQLSSGGNHTCALREDGIVRCWGYNAESAAPATRAAATGRFTQVDAGTRHTCAVRSDGAVQCWGWNGWGQAPSLMTASTGTFVAVSASNLKTCALRSDGRIQCWGNSLSYMAPGDGLTFTEISTGWAHRCALVSNGDIQCWGFNEERQAPPFKAARTGIFTQVSSGYIQTCALRSDGVIECWGYNGHGEAPRTRQAARGGSYSRVSLGFYHSCGLRTDGWVECWGDNSLGQLDMGTAPAPPASVTAAMVSSTQVATNWIDASGDEDAFQLQRGVWDAATGTWSEWTNAAFLTPNTTAWLNDGVVPATRYRYRVRACNLAGCSAWTGDAHAATVLPPGAPSSLAATASVAAQVNLAWTDGSADAVEFRLQRRVWDPAGGLWDPWMDRARTSADATAWSDADVLPGGRYRYRVRACNLAGCSDWVPASPVTVPAS